MTPESSSNIHSWINVRILLLIECLSQQLSKVSLPVSKLFPFFNIFQEHDAVKSCEIGLATSNRLFHIYLFQVKIEYLNLSIGLLPFFNR